MFALRPVLSGWTCKIPFDTPIKFDGDFPFNSGETELALVHFERSLFGKRKLLPRDHSGIGEILALKAAEGLAPSVAVLCRSQSKCAGPDCERRLREDGAPLDVCVEVQAHVLLQQSVPDLRLESRGRAQGRVQGADCGGSRRGQVTCLNMRVCNRIYKRIVVRVMYSTRRLCMFRTEDLDTSKTIYMYTRTRRASDIPPPLPLPRRKREGVRPLLRRQSWPGRSSRRCAATAPYRCGRRPH